MIDEEQLTEALRSGEPVVVGSGSLPLPAEDGSVSEDRVLQAQALRAVLRAGMLDPAKADPRGLIVIGAVVPGDLDLDHFVLRHGLSFIQCRFEGALSLAGARLGGAFVLRGSHLAGLSGPWSLYAEGLQTDGTVRLDGGFSTAGAVSLGSARIGDQLVVDGADIGGATADGWSVFAQGLVADSDVHFQDKFVSSGGVTLGAAQIRGQLLMDGAAVGRTDAGWGLYAQGMQASSDVHLNDGFRTSGAVSLGGAHIRGQLIMDGAEVEGTSIQGWALHLQNLRVDGSTHLRAPLQVAGPVTLAGARLGGQFNMRGAQIDGVTDAGRSLVAQGMQVDLVVYLDEGFECAGAVTLHGSKVGAQLSMTGARLGRSTDDGWSFDGQDLEIGTDAFFDDDFIATGTVTLHGARIGGHASFDRARIQGKDGDGCSLDLRMLQAQSDLYLGEHPEIAGTIRLTGSRIQRLVVAQATEPPPLDDVAGWSLGDLAGRPRTHRKSAAAWLAGQHTAQPWLELAALYDRIGQPSDARWIRYRSAVRSSSNGSWVSRAGRGIYRATTGHGYYPARHTLAWLLAIFLTAWTLTATHTDDFTTTTTPTIRQSITDQQKVAGIKSPPPVPGRVPASDWNDAWDTPEFQPWTYALSTAVPTTSSATSQPWTPRAGWLSAVLAGLRAASWIFAALFLAGITGLLRKQT